MVIRKEVHTRTKFASEMGALYFLKTKREDIISKGNVITCKHMRKYVQAWRIYMHYRKEYIMNSTLSEPMPLKRIGFADIKVNEAIIIGCLGVGDSTINFHDE